MSSSRAQNGLSLFLVPALLLAPHALWASEASELRAVLQGLLEQNEILRAQIDRQNETVRRLMIRIGELEEREAGTRLATASRGDQEPAVRSSSDQPETALSPEESSQPPVLFIRGFADSSFVATSSDPTTEDGANTFSLNELDLLITSQISSELSVLSEVVFHFQDIPEGGFFEIERLYATYAPTDLFNLRFGRMHTRIGYWNSRFHHGSWFQTTITRPQIHLFEDDGGILPVHTVGAELFGSRPTGPFDLRYSTAVGNGRGHELTAVQNFKDADKGKSLNLHLELSPMATPGLNFGLTTYLDGFPADPTLPDRRSEVDELIVMGHLVYSRQRIEILGEVARVRHTPKSTGDRFDTLGFYVQGAYQFKKWKPYFRYDFIDFDESDPIYSRPRQTDVSMGTLGLRWDPSTWMALKFEYRYTDRDRFPSAHTGAFQSAFAF